MKTDRKHGRWGREHVGDSLLPLVFPRDNFCLSFCERARRLTSPRPWTPSSADAAPTSTAKEPEPEPEQRVPAAKAAADGEVKVIQLDPTSRLYGSKLPSAAAMSRQANESASKAEAKASAVPLSSSNTCIFVLEMPFLK